MERQYFQVTGTPKEIVEYFENILVNVCRFNIVSKEVVGNVSTKYSVNLHFDASGKNYINLYAEANYYVSWLFKSESASTSQFTQNVSTAGDILTCSFNAIATNGLFALETSPYGSTRQGFVIGKTNNRFWCFSCYRGTTYHTLYNTAPINSVIPPLIADNGVITIATSLDVNGISCDDLLAYNRQGSKFPWEVYKINGEWYAQMATNTLVRMG